MANAIRYLALDVGGSCDGVFLGCIHAPHDDGAIQASTCDKLGVGGPGYAVDLKKYDHFLKWMVTA